MRWQVSRLAEQDFLLRSPPSRPRGGQWLIEDLSGHGRGGGCFEAHSLFEGLAPYRIPSSPVVGQAPAFDAPFAQAQALSSRRSKPNGLRTRTGRGRPPRRQNGEEEGRPRPDDGREERREGTHHRAYRRGQGE